MNRKGTDRRDAVLLALCALLSGSLSGTTWSAFSSTTQTPGNTFDTGTVALSDNDSGSAILSLANGKPGDQDVGCVVVTYSGSLDANVRLFGTTGGTGLDAWLDLTVTRGSIASPSPGSCTGFTADAADHIGAGAGVIFDGTLEAFPDNWSAGLVDPSAGSPETWSAGTEHAYRFVVTIQDTDSAQGKNATQEFIWEARDA